MIKTRFIFLALTLFGILSIQAQDFRFGKVSKQELEEKAYSENTEASAAVLFRKHRTSFDYQQGVGFTVITHVHERIKIYSKDGFDYATIAEKLYKNDGDNESISDIKAYTYNLVDGKIEKYKLKNSGVFNTSLNKYYDEEKFTLPNLKEGSVIEYEYRLRSPFYWSIDEISLQYDIPIVHQEVTIEIPEYFMFKPSMKGYLSLNPKYGRKSGKINFLSKQRSGGGARNTGYRQQAIDYTTNTTEFNMTDVPALVEEPFVNDMNNYRSAVNYELEYVQFPNSIRESFATTWEKVIKTIYESDGFGDQLSNSRYYRDDLEKLLVGITSDTEKVSRIFSHIQNRMSWNGFLGYSVEKGVKQAYKDQSGNVADINLILTSMLKEAGLDANPVLISTRDNGIPIFPTMEGFNYVVAAVTLKDQTVLLDASNKHTVPNLLPTRALNWFGRLVREDRTHETVSLFPSKPSEENIKMLITLSANGQTKGKIRTVYSDYDAYMFRNNHGKVPEDTYLENLESTHAGMEISEYEVANIRKMDKPIIEDFEFGLEGHVDAIGDKIYFSPLFHQVTEENPFKLEERNYPIDFTYPWQKKYLVNVVIPDGYEITAMPEDMNLALADGLGGFVYKLAAKGNTLQMLVDFKIQRPVITANYYQGLKELYKNAIEKGMEKVVLSKITDNGNTDSAAGSR